MIYSQQTSQNIHSGLNINNLSDHLPIFLIFDYNHNNRTSSVISVVLLMMLVILMKRRVGFISAATPLTLTVFRAPVIVVTRSFRLRVSSVKFLPTMAEAATKPMSYAASQL